MTKPRPRFLLIATLLASAGCANSSPAGVGSETNWLRQCSDDEDCHFAGACMCGLCSERCAADGDCSSGLVCKPAESTLVQNACGREAVFGMCSPSCERDADCAHGQKCAEGACTPAAAAAEPVASEEPSAAARAFVVAALEPDTSCVYASDNPIISIGQLDIAPGVASDSTNCEQGYRVRLKVASEAPGVIQLSGASVLIMTTDQETLLFAEEDPPLPNPFMFTASRTLIPAAGTELATGIVEVEAVRTQYQPFLADFVGDQILVAIRLQGTDAEDHPISFRPFLFPIDICDGCLSLCASTLNPQMTRDDFTQGQCDDNSGSDGRLCFDPDC